MTLPSVAQPSSPPIDPEASGFRASAGRTFYAVRAYPLFRRLWMAALAASMGQWMQSTALGWLAFEETNSKAFVGLVACVAGIPFFLISIPGGALLDRYDRRKVLMWSQGAAAAFATLVAIGVLIGMASPVFLLCAAFINGSLQAILSPSQQSLVPRLVDRKDLTNAVGLMSAGGNLTRIFGPSLAGAMLGFVGDGETFLLQAVAMLFALWSITTAKMPRMESTGGVMTVRSVLTGVGVVFGRADLRGIFILSSLPPLLIFPYISFMSVYARDILDIGAGGLGILMTSSGIGAVIGSLLVASRRRQDGVGQLIIILTCAYSLAVASFAYSTHLYFSLPLLATAAGLGAYFASSSTALMQLLITDDIRGRVMGTFMLTWGMMPIGALPMGMFAERVGMQTAIATEAIACLVLTVIVAIRLPILQEI